MKNGRFFIVTLALFAFASVVFVPSTFASNGNNNNPLPTQSQGCNPNSDPHNPHCATVSVPEFGFIPGAIALLTSTGAFIAFKKKNN